MASDVANLMRKYVRKERHRDFMTQKLNPNLICKDTLVKKWNECERHQAVGNMGNNRAVYPLVTRESEKRILSKEVKR